MEECEYVKKVALSNVARRLVEEGRVLLEVGEVVNLIKDVARPCAEGWSEESLNSFALSLLYYELPLYDLDKMRYGYRSLNNLVILIPPRLSNYVDGESFQRLLDELADLAYLHRLGVITREQLDVAVAYLLYDKLSDGDLTYGNSPIEWYHGVLMLEYSEIIDEDVEDENGIVHYRVGDVWIKMGWVKTLYKGSVRYVVAYSREG